VIEVQAGQPNEAMFPRSALKPMQAIAMLEAGFSGDESAIALAAASHSGEAGHVSGVRKILADAAVPETALQCPPGLPENDDATLVHVRSGGHREAVFHNCSGKHAAMLATCMSAGWPLETYLSTDHPLQRAFAAMIERYSGETIGRSATDGCGSAAFAVTLTGLARAFSRLGSAVTGTAAARVRDAMRSHPHLVGGTGRPVSELSAAIDGLICKDGAEGVWAAALPEGRSFALKLEDGAARALPPVVTALLRHWGVGGAVLAGHEAVPVYGGGRPVGAVKASPDLRAILAIHEGAKWA
jgi:L-asparaginase II